MKYIVMEEKEHDIFTKEFETAEEAIKEAKSDWEWLTAYDRKHYTAFYVLESANPDEDADDHWDGTPIYDAKDPKVTLNGDEVSFAAAVALMDNDIREAVHDELAPCTDQEFIDEYAARHEERFGEPFRV